MAKRRRQQSAPLLEPPRKPGRGVAIGLAAALGALLAAGLIARLRGGGERRVDRPDVLLITIDTLRADRLGCYGYAKAATPVLDALAARGVRFSTAVAHAPLTTPSHACILTGLIPPRHGIRDNGGFALPPGVATLAEAFGRAQYRTAAFVSGFPLDRRFGLARGFETYDDRLPHGDDPRRAAYVERRADMTTAAALRWLPAAASPWFLWVHYFDPHSPYEPPSEFREKLLPYDGEVAFVDAQIGRLLRGLEQKDASARTLVLVTADHGESLGEHDEETHGVFIYDATLRVPWIMSGPGIPPGHVAATVARGIDVAATLLDLAGLEVPKQMEGRSLREATRGESLPDRPAYVESLFASLQLGWAPLRGWRSAHWKLIDAPEPELYSLDDDPGETHDLSLERRDLQDAMGRELRRAASVATPDARMARDAEAAERLRSLGYLGGAAPAATGSRRNPKQGIALINRLERGIAEARADPDLATKELEAVLRESPRMALARRYLAVTRAAAKDYSAAIRELRALEQQGPLSADDLVLLADCLRLAGRPAEALEPAERAARTQPPPLEAELVMAKALTSLGRTEEAAAAYRRAEALAPGHVEALRGLGDLALARGDLASAAQDYQQILAANPDDVGARVKLGVALVRSQRIDEGLSLFRDAVERDPANGEALLALAGALGKSGRAAEAVPYFERAVEAGQRSTLALNGLGFARLEAGDARGALDALRSSLALDPSQAQVAEAVRQIDSGRHERSVRP